VQWPQDVISNAALNKTASEIIRRRLERLYDLRHTWATRAAESGIDLVMLAAMLGHSRIQMVMKYAHPTEEHQINVMRKLEEFTAMRQMEEYAAENPETLQ
jgi:integrase